ncbi:MAG: gluconokinase [Clostridiaceae bacterium]
MKYYLGVDIGTTSTKAIVFDDKGREVRKASREYPTLSPQAGFKEQDPEFIFQAVIDSINNAASKLQGEIAFISFSAAMHSIIAVDKEGAPLTNSIIWSDSRSESYAREYKISGKGREYYKRTGTPTHSMSPLYKLLWLRDNEREVFQKTYKFISIKEYVIYKLFNVFIVDYSIASASGLFNIYTRKFDEEILRDIGISEDKLSVAVPTTYILRGMDKYLSETMGISSSTPVVIGASDGCLANLGSNSVKEGAASITIGTSGAVRVAFNKPVTGEEETVFCYVLTEDKYIVGGAINNGGDAYRWFRDNFGELEVMEGKERGISSYEIFNRYLEASPTGSRGMIFLPFLTGERAPYWNSNLRGSFIGISDLHTKADFTRAVIEAICYSLKDVYTSIEALVKELKTVHINGGFMRCEEWIRTLSDIIARPLIVSQSFEAPCLGAVILGLYALKEYDSLEEAAELCTTADVYVPRKENIEMYNEFFQVYKESVERLIPLWERLLKYQTK